MKKVLLLGGAQQQIPSILKTKELGYYAITCDYLPNNPGHQYADEYHNISTTDKAAILALARKLKIDGVVAYASDPAATTAAFVAEKMGLPTSPYRAVEILSNKDLYRAFLSENGFHTPYAKGYTEQEKERAISDLEKFRFPIMIKPVDSSGSKGINKIESASGALQAIDEALSFSRVKRFLLEEFVQKKGDQISGDGFSVDGKLVFCSLGNEFYGDVGIKNYVPLGECWPSKLNANMQNKVKMEIQRLISALGMKSSAYNIEAILDQDDNIYIMELGARNGGSYIPQIIQYATGVDMVEYTIKAAVGDDCSNLKMTPEHGFWSNYMIHSRKSGRFKGFWIDPTFKSKHLISIEPFASVNDAVFQFENAGHAVGELILRYESMEDTYETLKHLDEYIRVIVE